APGGIGARRATTWKNTVSFHGRVFTTPRRRSIGGRPFTAYVHTAFALDAMLPAILDRAFKAEFQIHSPSRPSRP
ncbi:MAG: hypothetical protein ABSA47_04020, partial [Verrucomicrobiota bacterium]